MQVAITAALSDTFSSVLLRILRYRAEHPAGIERPLVPNTRLNLNEVRDADALHDFRFVVADIRRIAAALRLPDAIITDARDRCQVADAVAMLLMRLVYPCRLSLLRKTFGRSEPSCCRIVLHTGMHF